MVHTLAKVGCDEYNYFNHDQTFIDTINISELESTAVVLGPHGKVESYLGNMEDCVEG